MFNRIILSSSSCFTGTPSLVLVKIESVGRFCGFSRIDVACISLEYWVSRWDKWWKFKCLNNGLWQHTKLVWSVLYFILKSWDKHTWVKLGKNNYSTLCAFQKHIWKTFLNSVFICKPKQISWKREKTKWKKWNKLRSLNRLFATLGLSSCVRHGYEV